MPNLTDMMIEQEGLSGQRREERLDSVVVVVAVFIVLAATA